MKKKVLLVVGLTSVMCLANCSSRTVLPTEQGRVLIDADAEGMRALSDWTNGLVTTGKARGDARDTPYHEMRREQEKARTLRFQIKRGGAK